MSSSRAPKAADCIRQLADKRRTPDADAPSIDETVFNLVRAYAHHFAYVCGHAKQHASADESMNRCHRAAKTSRERLAIRCLQDLNATAALVKDIALTDTSFNEDQSFHAVDLGAGTGILSVGAAIAGLRSGAKQITLHVVDCEKELLDHAAEALCCTGNDVAIEAHDADIMGKNIYEKIEASNVRLWMSETISQGTPAMKIVRQKLCWPERGTSRYDIDPFPAVMNQMAETVPDFVESVQLGYTKLFPDCINGMYVPGAQNALCLPSSKSHRQHGPLDTVGRDFHALNPKNEYFRWGV